MKVVYQKEVGDFSLSYKQLEYLYKLSQEEFSKYPEIAETIKNDYVYYEEFVGQDSTEHCYLDCLDDLAFRSHPWLIKTEEAVPNEEHAIKEIEGMHYLIQFGTVGAEKVIGQTETEKFIKGY